jgi:hypothetical protein
MTRLKLLGAAAILSLLAATGAHAQVFFDEPGLYAFTYPMGDPNAGPARSPSDAMAKMHPGRRMKSHVMMVRPKRPAR